MSIMDKLSGNAEKPEIAQPERAEEKECPAKNGKPMYRVKFYEPELVEVPHISMTEKEAQQAGYSYRKKSRNKAKITKYKGTEAEVIVPAEIGGMTVNEIGANAFRNTQIREIRLPGTVKNIGAMAFRDSQVKRVVSADGLLYIGYCAFYNCRKLREIVLPNTLKTMGKACFMLCTALEEIRIPNSCWDIGDDAFRNTPLREIYVGIMNRGYNLRNGNAFKECKLERDYSAILTSSNRVLLVSKGADIAFSGDRIEFVKGALLDSNAPRAKRIDLSECRYVQLNEDVKWTGYKGNDKTEFIVPEGCLGHFYSDMLDTRSVSGKNFEHFNNISMENSEEIMCVGRVIGSELPSNFLDCKEARELIFSDNIFVIHDRCISGRSLESIVFEKRQLPQIFGRLLNNAPNVRKICWVWTNKHISDPKYIPGQKLAIYLPSAELIGYRLRSELENALTGRIIDEPRIYGKQRHSHVYRFFDKDVVMRVFKSDKTDRILRDKVTANTRQKILIAIDVLRSADYLYSDEREVYKKYLFNHKKYAKLVCAELPEKYSDYSNSLEDVLK